MSIYKLDPLTDARWPEFLQRHPSASVFHTQEWLRALSRTYGYTPVVFTTSGPGKDLFNGLVFCDVSSWLTGRRLVSLPFCDHCDPLLHNEEDLLEILDSLGNEARTRHLKYVEIRPRSDLAVTNIGFAASAKFAFHKVDLRPSTNELLQLLHKDSIRRKIQRAEREGVAYTKGTSRTFVEKFYHLMVMTRKRHGLPPAPLVWFLNLVEYLGEAAQIRLASQGERVVAGMFTTSYKKEIVYKYGGSDSRFNNLGGMPFLFWRTMQEAKADGTEALDLGRSDQENDGLITFKRRLGGAESTLTYWRLPLNSSVKTVDGRNFGLAKRIIALTPDRLRIRLGSLLYKHLG